MKRYQAISRALGALRRCEASGNQEWQAKHSDAIDTLCDDLPSGSGFDSGSKLDLDESTPEKLVFTTAYHHINDCGMYDGWTEHKVILTPSLEMGCHLRVTGSDRNQIKDYIAEQFGYILEADVIEWTGYPKTAETSAA